MLGVVAAVVMFALSAIFTSVNKIEERLQSLEQWRAVHQYGHDDRRTY